MKNLWWLFVIIPAIGAIVVFVFSQEYKHIAPPVSPTPQPLLSTMPTTSQNFCEPKDLEAVITTEGAAGNIYGTLTLKNISPKNCTIQGDNFISATLAATNVIPDQQGDKGPATIDLNSNQTVYSQMHFPNGPQCSSGIIQSPVTFTYQISPANKVTFKTGGNLGAASVTACKASSEITQLDVWSISLQPLH